MAEAAEPLPAADREFFSYDGPTPGVKYPVKVLYCGGKLTDAFVLKPFC